MEPNCREETKVLSAFSLWHNYVQHVVPAAAQVIRIHHPSAAFRELAFIRGTVHCVIAIVFGKKHNNYEE